MYYFGKSLSMLFHNCQNIKHHIYNTLFRYLYLRNSIPVTRKESQLKKEEPRDKIEMHLGGCNNPIKPEVHHELYTESQDCTSH